MPYQELVLPHFDAPLEIRAESAPSPPTWFGEAMLLVSYLRQLGVLPCERELSSVRSIAESRLDTFGNQGNGRDLEELQKARASITH